MSYPTALPTRTTGLDPEGIGAIKSNLTPLNEAERAERIPEDEYNRVLDAVVAVCAILGEDGSTDDAAIRVRVAALESTVIWRPMEPTPSGNVYADAADALDALSTIDGVATIIVDPSLSAVCQIPAGAYPLACSELQIIGLGGPTVVFLAGITFTGGTIRGFAIDTCTVEWRGAAPLFGVGGPACGVLLRSSSSLVSGVGATSVMFDLGESTGIQCQGVLNNINSSAGYELFAIAATKGLYLFPGLQSTITTNAIRGAGNVAVFMNSTDGATVSAVQANLSGSFSTTYTDAALRNRVTALEAPTSVDENGAAIAWTTQARIRNIHGAALAVFTTSATTDQWPVGQSRLLANFSTATFGVRVNVPVGHYLNGILNGTTGTLGTYAAAAGVPLYSLLITREASDRWSWS